MKKLTAAGLSVLVYSVPLIQAAGSVRTNELKALLKAAKTKEEAKEILLAHKSELTDEEIEKVNGGQGDWRAQNGTLVTDEEGLQGFLGKIVGNVVFW